MVRWGCRRSSRAGFQNPVPGSWALLQQADGRWARYSRETTSDSTPNSSYGERYRTRVPKTASRNQQGVQPHLSWSERAAAWSTAWGQFTNRGNEKSIQFVQNGVKRLEKLTRWLLKRATKFSPNSWIKCAMLFWSFFFMVATANVWRSVCRRIPHFWSLSLFWSDEADKYHHCDFWCVTWPTDQKDPLVLWYPGSWAGEKDVIDPVRNRFFPANTRWHDKEQPAQAGGAECGRRYHSVRCLCEVNHCHAKRDDRQSSAGSIRPLSIEI